MIVDISIGMKLWLGRQATVSFATGSVIRRRAVIVLHILERQSLTVRFSL